MNSLYNGKECNFIFVSFITGFVSFIVVFILLLILKSNFNENNLSNSFLFDLDFQEIVFALLMILIGFFIHGIRYLGFDYYRKIYKKNKETNKYKIRKRILFYIFRNGTSVEECFNEKREEKTADVFDWIKNSKEPHRDIWNYSLLIHQKIPESNIYRFYFHSEVFQCLDTLFLFMAIIYFVTLFYVIFYEFVLLKIIYIGVLVFTLIIFHRFCKAIGKSFVRRFFLEIQIGLNTILKQSPQSLGGK